MKDRLRRQILKLKHRLRAGDPGASSNIAATYREMGNVRRAFHWWKRAAGPHDGDSWLEVGFCLQYGIGTRRNLVAAIRAYRRSIRTYYTTMYGREEAQYHLAVALLDRAGTGYLREVTRLLSRAAEDGAYPAAADLVGRLTKNQTLRICRCRRGLARRLGGKAQCPLHV